MRLRESAQTGTRRKAMSSFVNMTAFDDKVPRISLRSHLAVDEFQLTDDGKANCSCGICYKIDCVYNRANA